MLFKKYKLILVVFFKFNEILLPFNQNVRFFKSRLTYLLSLWTDLLKWSAYISFCNTCSNTLTLNARLPFSQGNSWPPVYSWNLMFWYDLALKISDIYELFKLITLFIKSSSSSSSSSASSSSRSRSVSTNYLRII